MAETKTKRTTGEQESQRGLAPQRESGAAQRWDPRYSTPLEFIDHMSAEMDRWFDDVTRGLGFSRLSHLPRSRFGEERREGVWFPRIEAGQKGDTFVVRAELPGLKREDINVEMTDDAITIRGERRAEHEEEREGYWRSEREYGEFHRTIPLPEGVIAESAQATFRDGVLEIRVQAPPAEANRGRRLEISEGGAEPKR